MADIRTSNLNPGVQLSSSDGQQSSVPPARGTSDYEGLHRNAATQQQPQYAALHNKHPNTSTTQNPQQRPTTAPGRPPPPSSGGRHPPPPSSGGRHPPPPSSGGRPPPPPTSGGRHPPPLTSGGRPPPPPTSGGRYPPPPTSDGRPPPPTSGGRYPPPPTSGGRPPPPPTSGGRPPPPPISDGRPPPPTSGGRYPPPSSGGQPSQHSEPAVLQYNTAPQRSSTGVAQKYEPSLQGTDVRRNPNGTSSDRTNGYNRHSSVSITSDRSSTALNPEGEDELPSSTLGKLLHFLDTEYSMMQSFPATLNTWISFWLLPFSLILYLAAFSTVGWAEVDSTVIDGSPVNRKLGLWQLCHNISGCRTLRSKDVGDSSGYQAAQVFSVFSLLALFCCVVAYACYIFFPTLHKTSKMRYAAMASRIATVLCLLLTFAVYAGHWYQPAFQGSSYKRQLRYSHTLCIIAWITELAALSFFILEVYNKQHESLHLTSLSQLQELAAKQAEEDYKRSSTAHTGWEEMPDKPRGQSGWEEMPDKPRGQSGWEEMPDKPRGQSGWEEMPHRRPQGQSSQDQSSQGQSSGPPPATGRIQGRRSIKKSQPPQQPTYNVPQPSQKSQPRQAQQPSYNVPQPSYNVPQSQKPSHRTGYSEGERGAVNYAAAGLDV